MSKYPTSSLHTTICACVVGVEVGGLVGAGGIHVAIAVAVALTIAGLLEEPIHQSIDHVYRRTDGDVKTCTYVVVIAVNRDFDDGSVDNGGGRRGMSVLWGVMSIMKMKMVERKWNSSHSRYT